MELSGKNTCTAFAGTREVAHGSYEEVVLESKRLFDRGEKTNILIFDDDTAQQRDADLGRSLPELERWLSFVRKTAAQATIAARDEDPTEAGEERAQSVVKPGRPKLGVVSREVTLLPRHWQWLNAQPGGASVALRKLVEAAKRDTTGKEQKRLAQEATYRFMSAMAGNEAGFEEASRALFAGKRSRFAELTEHWPADVSKYLQKLAVAAFDATQKE
ncbi:MAG: DUF2239 family protein [Cyanobacteria bacterium REEB67]|nr:DUF2239 family protein [Cyanobacteria bacterium REEB67]